jgi:hypothetical protein
VEDTAPRLMYNPDDGSVILNLGGPAVTVDGIEAEVTFERITPTGETSLALWLEAGQADVLAKMIRHILETIKIRPESQQALSDLLPQVEAVLERHGGG